VILVSPNFEILLLHRVQTSSSFPSAHVFPGGMIDKPDGFVPDTGVERHQDNMAYRAGALRELFEESGILLAKERAGSPQLLSIPQAASEQGRKVVHSGRTPFQDWLHEQSPNTVLDTEGLIPFSHWITPPNIPRRFTTQMYLYILPSDVSKDALSAAEPTWTGPPEHTTPAFAPSSDGGLENIAATFAPAHTWLRLAQSGAIILFPPQFLLLHLISQFLDNKDIPPQQRVQQLKQFVHHKEDDGSPPWSEKCISPYALALPRPREDGKVVLALDKPGPELEGKGEAVRGDAERVVLVRMSKEGPRDLEIRNRTEVVEEGRRSGEDVARKEGAKL
jgi:8-oxo-dGTP pyrophosphatase MutT (NUDIX family)